MIGTNSAMNDHGDGPPTTKPICILCGKPIPEDDIANHKGRPCHSLCGMLASRQRSKDGDADD